MSTDDRTMAQSPRERQAERVDRAAAEQDDGAPVPRLFVNGDVIAIDDILRPLRRELVQDAETTAAERYHETVQAKIVQEFRRQVRSLLLYQQAAKRIGEQEEEYLQGLVDDAVRQRINTDHRGRQSSYEEGLAEEGLTQAEDRERIRREILVMRYLHQNVTSRVLDPTRAELVRFFEQEKEKLTKPERRSMDLIEVSLGGSGQATTAPGELITRAKAELDDGADFATVVAEYSQGIHADEGGAWGWLTRGSVREHWEPALDALFNLPEGATSGIIETDEALFIVRCARIEPAVEPEFESLQLKLTESYRDAQFNRMVEEQVRELLSEAVFVPADLSRFLRAVAEAAPPPARS
ncbi:MAG: hypothetical protein GY842_00765 [bacterium]|nr:hypothetical protein [bacterium]